jgi:hypothetical protein
LGGLFQQKALRVGRIFLVCVKPFDHAVLVIIRQGKEGHEGVFDWTPFNLLTANAAKF